MRTYQIREGGKNGTVILQDGLLVRTIAHRVRKDDRQTMPVSALTAIHHNRKRMATDEVTLTVGVNEYHWKVKDAEAFVELLNWCIANQMTPDQFERQTS